MNEQMEFPETFEKFSKAYGFKDDKEVYTNGSELIPVFRVEQWLEHILTPKNDLGVDCISRQAVLEYIEGSEAELGHSSENELVCQDIKELPPVTPHPKTGHWISIDDAMSVFDDFMCGEVDEDGTNTFLEMLKDKAKSEEQESCNNVAVTHKNLCDSCTTQGCIFQSGIIRSHCDFYKSESEET